MKFASLYEKLVKFLRNREITGVSRKAGAGDSKDPAVYSTEVFQMELNRAHQRRENNRRQKEFKKKKLLERNHTRDFGKARSETDKSGRGGPPKRKVWFCNVHGNQQITLPNGARLYTLSFYRRRPSLFKPGITHCIESKPRSRRQKQM